MLNKVVSGGQTGADQAGWRAAKKFGIETGGWMPIDFMTEDGPAFQFKHDFGAREIELNRATMIYAGGGLDYTAMYRERTRLNVRDCDFAIWFGLTNSRGGLLTLRTIDQFNKPFVCVPLQRSVSPEAVKRAILNQDRSVILIAGNRESVSPGIGAWVEEYLCSLFQLLGFARRT